MINLIADAIIVTAGSWLLVKKYFWSRLFTELILNWFILFFSQIILVGLILGIMGRLYFLNVFMAHLFILVAITLSCHSKKMPSLWKPDLHFFMNSNLFLFIFSIFVSFFLVKLYVTLVNPLVYPDGLQFHLAFPAHWIVNGNLDNPFQIFGSVPILNPNGIETSSGSYYPINVQLFFTWLMLPLRSAFLADAGQTPFFFIGIIAVYSILRKYNVKRNIALLSGFLWVLIPNIFKQLRIGSNIDVICAVLFLLVFYTLLLLKFNFTFKNVSIIHGFFG